MAKWGEGDPRWIVEERPDATNVNNWHWTEKNATEWSRNRFRALFEGQVLEDSVGRCEITKMSESSGEAFANNRKSKLIFFYEWVLEFEWTGKVAGDDTAIEGKIKVPNFSEEYTVKELDIEVSVTVTKSSPAAEKMKLLVKTKGIPLVRKQLETYLKELTEEYGKDLILPTKGLETPLEPVKAVVPKISQAPASQGAANSSVGVRIETEDLKLSEDFHCTADDIYRALTQDEMVRAFTHSDVIVNAEKGGKFSIFNGMVTGDFVELVKNEKIVQRWRFKSWPEAHYSTVTFNFKQTESGTSIKMTQTGIPKNDFVRTKEGWKRYYWDSLRATFGFGSLLT